MSKSSLNDPLSVLMYQVKDIEKLLSVKQDKWAMHRVIDGDTMLIVQRGDEGSGQLIAHGEMFEPVVEASSRKAAELRAEIEVTIREETRDRGIIALFDITGRRVFHS